MTGVPLSHAATTNTIQSVSLDVVETTIRALD